MYLALKDLQKKYGSIPIYITENGLGIREEPVNGNIDDEKRIEFLNDHITELLRAKTEGVNMKGYYVWSTFDLYSWVNGYEKRYGLVYVDFNNNLRRKPKKSYYWYRDFIKHFEEEN
jgi:beta-glucosidase/6-phospho-beta-glucosidase/beta-galactosidase